MSVTIFACTVCFGASEGALITGSNAGIAVLIGITLTLLGSFAAFFIHLKRMARRAEQSEPPC